MTATAPAVAQLLPSDAVQPCTVAGIHAPQLHRLILLCCISKCHASDSPASKKNLSPCYNVKRQLHIIFIYIYIYITCGVCDVYVGENYVLGIGLEGCLRRAP